MTVNYNTAAFTANLRFYEATCVSYINKTLHLDLSELQQAFLTALAPSGTILDAGCGSGRDSLFFAAKGHQVTSIDASPAMVQASKSLGCSALLMKFDAVEFEAAFNGIWACASLLHVPHAEIADVLCRLIRALKDDGIIFITLKEGVGECFAEDGRFFAYYSLEEFANILGGHKALALVQSQRTFDTGKRPWLNYLARKLPLSSREDPLATSQARLARGS
jgi:SAM-dependent methyltransferase